MNNILLGFFIVVIITCFTYLLWYINDLEQIIIKRLDGLNKDKINHGNRIYKLEDLVYYLKNNGNDKVFDRIVIIEKDIKSLSDKLQNLNDMSNLLADEEEVKAALRNLNERINKINKKGQ